jgi:hypothetical protein
MRTNTLFLTTAVAIATALLVLPSRAADNGTKNETEQIAEEAYIYAFPMVMGYGAAP